MPASIRSTSSSARSPDGFGDLVEDEGGAFEGEFAGFDAGEVEELIDSAHRAGRQAAQRNTEYEILQRYPDPMSPDLDFVAVADNAPD